MKRLKIALTGASGFIGSHLAESIVARGHELTCLLRKTSSTRYLQNISYKSIYGDVVDFDSLPALLEGQDVLIHAAGLTKARNESEYMFANASGTENLLKAMVSTGMEEAHFILLSTQAAAGPATDGQPLDEKRPLNPLTAYGRSKAKAEEICGSYSDRIPTTIIRPPTVFGPRDRDVLAFFKFIKLGIQPIIGQDNRLSIVSVMNLVHGIMLAVEQGNTGCEIYYITDDENVTWTQFGGLIAGILEKKPLRIKVPFWTLHLVSAMGEIYGKVMRKAVLLNREKMLEVKQPEWLVSNQKAREELGYRPVVTTREAVSETVTWYQEAGWL